MENSERIGRRRPMKILVVDDSKVMRMIVKKTLRKAGFGGAETAEAADGKEGLAKVAEFNPDIVLSDWNMPEMTGIEFLRSLRASGDERPFGFVTSEGSDTMRAEATEAGALFLVAKPFGPDELAEQLGKVKAA